jgi:response regulator of citrate/malate metabolism
MSSTLLAPGVTGDSQMDSMTMQRLSQEMQAQQTSMTMEMMNQQMTNSRTSAEVSKTNAAKDITKSVQL